MSTMKKQSRTLDIHGGPLTLKEATALHLAALLVLDQEVGPMHVSTMRELRGALAKLGPVVSALARVHPNAPAKARAVPAPKARKRRSPASNGTSRRARKRQR